MRFKNFIAPLILIPICAYSQVDSQIKQHIYSPNTTAKYTLEKKYSNQGESFFPILYSDRTQEYPTQVIRLSSNVVGQQLSCEQVNDEIEKSIINHITSDKFIFNTYISCTYDPETQLAVSFLVNSYFDPINDEGIDYLKDYLEKYNGYNLLGAKLSIESAKGLVISLNISAGTKKKPSSPPFLEFRQDRSNYYFASNYEMSKHLFNDIYESFFTNEPDKILPFLDKWIFANAGSIYLEVLRNSNYVELQPERIFIMEEGDPIFVSNLKFYFGHNCSQYKNHRCLKKKG